MSKLKIIIVDDHDMFRDGVKSLLEIEEIAEVIAEASNGKEFLDLLDSHKPDLVLMDIDMPVMNGIDATQKALEINPDLKIMVLTMFGDEKYYVKMIEAGAKGFLLKSSNKNELETAVREVASGQTYFSNELLRKIIARIGMPVKSNKSEDEVHNFSERETEIIQHMCQGLTTSEIAEKLFLSAKTVENYRVRLLQKTGCKNAVSLVVYAIKNKIVVI